MSGEAIAKAAEQHKDWSKLVVFDEKATVIHASYKADPEELKEFLPAFKERGPTLGKGLTLAKEHYDIHRWSYNPCVTYGRRGKPGNMQGICLHKFTNEKTKKDLYAVITFGGDATTARMVPQLVEFCAKHVATV
eukprot:CAMPEP_0170176538 /NCGR_PEP_ID=MMETSP0040_2-20121228/9395_1 /TAXON_ID=641309 /ORGANISM="Lotharella oceanica, Strain CCMP622" /LENGTH=134 /DNA_ID=CAMNT_0010418897 /DNA_START=33 /DNA_END=437 /DNA_ORIENTATION=+